MSVYDKSPRILVIRRDNIGDLVCTTPLIHALRERFPQGWIGAMVNSYNAPVLDGNQDLDGVYVYTKAKHRSAKESLIGIFWQRLQMMRTLRAMQIDDVIIATTSPQPRVVQLARWLKPKRIIAFGHCGADVEMPLADTPRHEVEDVFRVAALYGIKATPCPCKIVTPNCIRHPNLVAIHISARKHSQRWAADNFIKVMQQLNAISPDLKFILLWAPGANDDPRHPGDDAKAAEIINVLGKDFPVTAIATHTLPELINALSSCSVAICSDGGAMHLSAGLSLPVVALFFDFNIARWRPWGVPQRILHTPTNDVANIPVADVVAAFSALRADIPAPTF